MLTAPSHWLCTATVVHVRVHLCCWVVNNKKERLGVGGLSGERSDSNVYWICHISVISYTCKKIIMETIKSTNSVH